MARRCDCRKWLRWTQDGKQRRITGKTRSWSEAEKLKRELEDQLAGRSALPSETGQSIRASIEVFLQDKTNQGVTKDVLAKYRRELERLRAYAEANRVYAVQGVNRELLTGFCATWEAVYPSTSTRSKVRERVRGFLRYAFEAQWLVRIPALPKITINVVPTLPLTNPEYARLLDATYALRIHEDANLETGQRARSLIQLMRWSGLAIRDALTLRRDEIRHDERKGVYRIVTSRQKTGTHVSVPIPPAIALQVLATPNTNPAYIFWSGQGSQKTITNNWSKKVIAPLFALAKIPRGGNMTSHRLRDTFAVELLERGVPMEEVSRLLGHTSIKTTEKSYARWSKGRQDRADALVIGTWDPPATPERRRSLADASL